MIKFLIRCMQSLAGACVITAFFCTFGIIFVKMVEGHGFHRDPMVLEAFRPIVALAFTVIVTAIAFQHFLTGIMSVAGSAAYGYSWSLPIESFAEKMIASSTGAVGVGCWIMAAMAAVYILQQKRSLLAKA